MVRRKQNLVLFYEETSNEKLINNRLVRSYVNHFVIDESEETEIIAEFNIHEKEALEPIVKKAVIISKEWLTNDRSTHFIFGSMLDCSSKSVVKDKSGPLTDQNIAPLNFQELANYHWSKFMVQNILICTSLTGYYDHLKTKLEMKAEWNKDQFDSKKCSVADDL